MTFNNNVDNKNNLWHDNYKRKYEKSFDKIDLLNKKSEYWKFALPTIWHGNNFNKRKLQENTLINSKYKFDYNKDIIIKIINGKLDMEVINSINKSNKNIEICCLKEIGNLKNHWSETKFGRAQFNAEKSYARPLALYNGSKAIDGLFIKFNKSMKNQIHIIYDGEEKNYSLLRNLFDIEENVEVKIVEHFYGNSKYNIVSEFFAGENSHFEHNKIINNGLSNSIIYHLFGNCKSSSNVKSINVSLSENPTRNEINLFLDGVDCDATIASLGFGNSDTSICDNTFFISHQDESCKSRQIVKNALSNSAKAIFQGKIFVSSKAQKTDGYQMSNGLILTDNCEFLVKPELEIYADDVVCSHGSISGTLNEEHLFYLQSRGIPLPEAQKKLIRAFFEEVVDEISDQETVNYIHSQISEMLT